MTTPAEVRAAFVDERGWPRPSAVLQAIVRPWLDDSDLEVRGALYGLLQKSGHASRVVPPLTPAQLLTFSTGYLDDCIKQSAAAEDSRWVLSGLDLSHAIAHWVHEALRHDEYDEKQKLAITSWLRETFRSARDFKDLLSVALRDHVLSDARVRQYFRTWTDDPILVSRFPELSSPMP